MAHFSLLNLPSHELHSSSSLTHSRNRTLTITNRKCETYPIQTSSFPHLVTVTDKKRDERTRNFTPYEPLNIERNVMSVYFKETPSPEPFNVDPDLVTILEKNQALIEELEPLFIIHPLTENRNGTNAQCNISLIHIISFCQLFKFRRFPQSETLYSQEFSKTVRSKYGSSERYLRQRLGFVQADQNPLRIDQEGKIIQHFMANDALKDGIDYKVIKNEWPYAIPRDYQHVVVWSRLPLLNPNLSKSKHHWNVVLETGLSGFVNLSSNLTRKLEEFNLTSKSVRNVDTRLFETEIATFIEKRWKKEEGYLDLMWILNPVQLQSCPDLPHFHVFIKKPKLDS